MLYYLDHVLFLKTLDLKGNGTLESCLYVISSIPFKLVEVRDGRLVDLGKCTRDHFIINYEREIVRLITNLL